MATRNKIIAVLMTTAMLLPTASAFANLGINTGTNASINASTAAVSGSRKTPVNFCTNLASFTTATDAKINAADSTLNTKQQAIITAAQNREQQHAQQLSALRAKQDATRNAIYAKLTAKAATDAEKQAVLTFQASIEAAVVTRRAAVDAAIQAYWTGVMNDLSTRQTAVQTAQQNFGSAINAALATASSQCAAGTAAATVRQAFAASDKAARTKFASDREAVNKIGPEIKVLGQTRNTAIQTAIATFKTASSAAGAILKAAWLTAAPANTSVGASTSTSTSIGTTK